jgi:hypothetical protein
MRKKTFQFGKKNLWEVCSSQVLWDASGLSDLFTDIKIVIDQNLGTSERFKKIFFSFKKMVSKPKPSSALCFDYFRHCDGFRGFAVGCRRLVVEAMAAKNRDCFLLFFY